jgi:hypothetical protein
MLAFVHLHKTAGITINWILRRSFGLHHCDVEPWRKHADFFSVDDYHGVRKLYTRIDSISGHMVRAYSDLDQVCPKIQYFTFLREPVTRCASHYQYVIQRGRNIAFQEWINIEDYRNLQTKMIAGTDNLDAAINILREKFFFVGLVEHFDESLVMFRHRAADERLNIFYNSRNVAPNNTIKTRLLDNPQTRSQLIAANRNDLALYGFVSQKLYPQQKREYGRSLDSEVVHFREANHFSRFNTNLLLNFLKRRLFYTPIVIGYRLLSSL